MISSIVWTRRFRPAPSWLVVTAVGRNCYSPVIMRPWQFSRLSWATSLDLCCWNRFNVLFIIHSLIHGHNNFSYMLWIPIFAETMPTKPWNQIMNIVAADEKLYTDFRDHNKTEPCSVKFKTACIEQWVQMIEQDYNISATGSADGVQTLKSTGSIRVTMKCHISRLQDLMAGNMGVRTLLKTKGWSLVDTPRDGHCLLHATCLAYNNANPQAPINLDYLVDCLRKETEEKFALFRQICIDDPYIEFHRYVRYKVWNQPLVDLVPFSLSN